MRRFLNCLLLALLPACCSVPQAPDSPVVVQHLIDGFNQDVLEAAVKALAEQAPLQAPGSVVIRAIEEDYMGLTTWEGDHFQVLIEARQCMGGIIDTLLHEWAHAMVWNASQESQHDALWGVSYAHCYRIWLGVAIPERAELPLPADLLDGL